MATEDLKALTQRFYDEIFVNKNVDAIDEIIDDDFVDHEEFPGLPPGKEGVRAFAIMSLDAFPDFTANIEDMIVEDDKVAIRVQFAGTHRGEFAGVPATGNKLDFPTIDFLRFRDGKVVEHWGVTDQLLMMQQLGVIELPE